MSWEVQTMKSKISFFNAGLFRSTLRRFWPLWTIHFAGWLLFLPVCDVTRSVSKMTEIERRGGKRWDKPKKAEKSRDCGGGKF